MGKCYEFGLCDGRHCIPGITEYIFPEKLNPMDFDTMWDIAKRRIPEDAECLHVYVTGLTAAMMEVVSVCQMRGISLIAYHYNRDTGIYMHQIVLSYETCPFCGNRMSAYDRYCGNCGGN